MLRRRALVAAALAAGLSAAAAPGATGQIGGTTSSTTTTTSPSTVTRPTTTAVTRPTTTASTTTTTEPATTTTTASTVPTVAATTTTVATTTSTLPIGSATTAPGPDPTFATTLPLGVPTTTTTLPLVGDVGEVDDLEAWELEVTQGTQNLANDMPLVSGRTTMVRAYVRSADKAVTGVRGILGAWRGTKYLGSVVASNQPIKASTSGGLRVNTDDSLYFHVPGSWTAAGVVRLTVFAYQASVDFTFDNEAKTTNNFATEYVEFKAMDPLKLYLPPLHLHAAGTSGSPETTYELFDHLGDIVQILTGLERLLPVSGIQAVVPQTPLFPASHPSAEWDLNESSVDKNANRLAPLTVVAAAKAASNLYDDWSWYAMIDPAQPYTSWIEANNAPSNIAGSASGGVAQGKMDPSVEAAVPWDLTGAGTLAHELGHNGGLAHYLCAGNEAQGGGIDPDYPTPFDNCTMSIPTNSGYWGFDVHYSTFPYLSAPTAVSPKPDATKPNRSSPLMGYAADKWLDPYSYCKLLTAYGVGCSAYPPPEDDGPGLNSGAGAPGPRPRLIAAVTQGAPARFVTVSGVVRPGTGTATLLDVATAGEATQEARTAAAARYEAVRKAGPSGFRLRLVAPGGETIERVLADVDPPAHDEDRSAFAFTDLVEAPFSPVTVQILGGDAVVAERRASATAPTVRVVAPNGGERLAGAVEIRWESADPDGDRLVHDVAYSPDGGRRWRVVAMGVTGTSLRLDVAGLEASGAGRFRVSARDGFHTASDSSDADVVAPDGPPAAAFVLSPNSGRTFRLGDVVVLRGTASDLTDGVVTGLSWRSDRDGDLGTGAEVHTRSLSAGPHRITLTATDSAGGTAEMGIDVVIDGSQLADVPDAAELAKLEARLKAAPVPAEGDAGGGGSTAVAVVGVGAALSLLGGAALLARRRRRPGD